MQLFLTPSERELYSALPQSVQLQGCTIVEESSDCYEIAQQLEARSRNFAAKYPELRQKLLDQGLQADFSFLDEPSDDFINDYFFAIGATGITVHIVSMLSESGEIDWEALASLTEYRHRLLESNDSSFSS